MKFFFPRVIFIVEVKSELRIHKNLSILSVSANSSIFGIFQKRRGLAETPPVILNQNIKSIIPNKNHKKIEDIFSHFAKKAIGNLKNCQNFESVAET